MRYLLLASALILAACGNSGPDSSKTGTANSASYTQGLASPASFTSISNKADRSKALFTEMFKVISHPRCMNCHPRGDEPVTQGDDMAPHSPPISRGADDFGQAGMKCSTCHGPENVSYSASEGSVPGHDPWHVAPRSMGWQGLTMAQVCEALKNPQTNGDRTLEEIFEHNAKDGLVGWGWNPGDGREPVPGTQIQFGELTRAWIDTGAHCPE